MWNPSLKSHIAEVMSPASYCARTGRLLGKVAEMLAVASACNRDFCLVFPDGECSPAQQSSLL